MDYLTFLAIILTVWPFYYLMYLIIRKIFDKVDHFNGFGDHTINSRTLTRALIFCEKQHRRERHDMLDDLIYNSIECIKKMSKDLNINHRSELDIQQ